MWSSGNYATIGTTLQIVGEELCEAVDLAGGSPVLDVGAGNGSGEFGKPLAARLLDQPLPKPPVESGPALEAEAPAQ